MNTRFRAHEVVDGVGRSGAERLVHRPVLKEIDFASIVAASAPSAPAGLLTLVADAERDAGEADAPLAAAGQTTLAYAARALTGST